MKISTIFKIFKIRYWILIILISTINYNSVNANMSNVYTETESEYVVKEKDSLWQIAKRFKGKEKTQDYLHSLVLYNDIEDNQKQILKVGQVLKLPKHRVERNGSVR